MTFKFQILYRLPECPPGAIVVEAKSKEEAEARVRNLFSEPGLVLNVGPATSDLPRGGLSIEEQAWYLGIGQTELFRLKKDKIVPRPAGNGKDIVPIRFLDRVLANQLNVEAAA